MYILNIEETLCGFTRRQPVVLGQDVVRDWGSRQCTENGRDDHTESDNPPASRHHPLMTLATSARFLHFRQIAKLRYKRQTPSTTHWSPCRCWPGVVATTPQPAACNRSGLMIPVGLRVSLRRLG